MFYLLHVLVQMGVVCFGVALVPGVMIWNVGGLKDAVVVPAGRGHVSALIIRMVQLMVSLVLQMVLQIRVLLLSGMNHDRGAVLAL